ncbi:MAG: hypothetical protein AAF380_02570 [Bacteroidota bacterium]
MAISEENHILTTVGVVSKGRVDTYHGKSLKAWSACHYEMHVYALSKGADEGDNPSVIPCEGNVKKMIVSPRGDYVAMIADEKVVLYNTANKVGQVVKSFSLKEFKRYHVVDA